MNTQKSKDLKQVQDHYLDYPYPHRNPDNKKRQLMPEFHINDVNIKLREYRNRKISRQELRKGV